jgi:hypothetical protein
VATVAELIGPDCGIATKETDKDNENLDFVDEDIIKSNHMDYKFYYSDASEEEFFFKRFDKMLLTP